MEKARTMVSQGRRPPLLDGYPSSFGVVVSGVSADGFKVLDVVFSVGFLCEYMCEGFAVVACGFVCWSAEAFEGFQALGVVNM
jgi:hypothetical protein